jgi:hypothetical protein
MAGVPVDPWSAGFMALGSIASAPPPSMTGHLSSPNTFDNSGFAVNVGGGTAQATSTKTALPSAAQAAQAVAAGAGSLLSNPAFIVVIGLGLYLYLKHK